MIKCSVFEVGTEETTRKSFFRELPTQYVLKMRCPLKKEFSLTEPFYIYVAGIGYKVYMGGLNSCSIDKIMTCNIIFNETYDFKKARELSMALINNGFDIPEKKKVSPQFNKVTMIRKVNGGTEIFLNGQQLKEVVDVDLSLENKMPLYGQVTLTLRISELEIKDEV